MTLDSVNHNKGTAVNRNKNIAYYSDNMLGLPVSKSIKILVISDTHGFIHPDIIKLMPQYGVLIHAGDILEEESLTQLDFSGKLITVSGNNDSHLSHLNKVAILDLFGQQLVIEHGHTHGHYQPCHNSLRQTYPNAKAVIYGHTHKQVVDQSKKPWIINPGAAGKTRTHGGASCLSLIISADEWQIQCWRFKDL